MIGLLNARIPDALAWSLWQSVWQGTLLAGLAAAALAVGREWPAENRYRVLGSAGVLAAIAFCVDISLARAAAPPPWLRGAAVAWLIGVGLLSVRLVGGWWVLRRLRTGGLVIGWEPTVRRLSERLQVARRVRVVESGAAQAPGLIGWRKPMIVLPSSTLAAAGPGDIEAVLAHELAHVRRGDFAANLVHAIIETIFFFHPVIWWLSYRTRIERERSCDDRAAALFEDSITYAEALLHLEQQRTDRRGTPRSVGGAFVSRVRRLVDQSPSLAVAPSSWTSIVTFQMAAMVGLWMLHLHAPMAPILSPSSLGYALPTATAPLAVASVFGLLLGIRHACEPDHLLAVSTLISRARGARRATTLGLAWGMGHTASLVVVGAGLAAMHLQLTSTMAELFEFGVSLMLIALGSRSVCIAWRQGAHGPAHRHSHGLLTHEHGGALDHLHVGGWSLARRPLLVGVVHGLAGSGALTALVMASLPTLSSQVAYILVFGAGSAIGMATLSACAGGALTWLVDQRAVMRGLSWTSGALSLAYGVWTGSPFLWHALVR